MHDVSDDRVASGTHLVAGDPLRAVAALGVLTFHLAAGVVFLRTGGLDFDAAYGRVGSALLQAGEQVIYVFFALSGYLIARPWVAGALGRRPWPDPGDYAVRRVGRIVPAFWVTCVLILLLYGTRGSSLTQVVALFSFGQVYALGPVAEPIGHGWSLDVEMLFYAVLPLGGALAWWGSRLVAGAAARALVALAVVLAIALVGFLLRHQGLDSTPAIHSPAGALRAFLPGIALAVLDVRFGARLRGWRFGPAVAAGCGLAGAALFVAILELTTSVTQLSLTLGTLAGGLLLGGAVLLQRSAGRAWRVLGSRPMAWLGERSYSIFLLHGIPIYELRSLYLDHGGSVAAGLVIAAGPVLITTLAGAWALHRLVEAPCMARAKRLTARGPAAAVRATPVAS